MIILQDVREPTLREHHEAMERGSLTLLEAIRLEHRDRVPSECAA